MRVKPIVILVLGNAATSLAVPLEPLRNTSTSSGTSSIISSESSARQFVTSSSSFTAGAKSSVTLNITTSGSVLVSSASSSTPVNFDNPSPASTSADSSISTTATTSTSSPTVATVLVDGDGDVAVSFGFAPFDVSDDLGMHIVTTVVTESAITMVGSPSISWPFSASLGVPGYEQVSVTEDIVSTVQIVAPPGASDAVELDFLPDVPKNLVDGADVVPQAPVIPTPSFSFFSASTLPSSSYSYIYSPIASSIDVSAPLPQVTGGSASGVVDSSDSPSSSDFDASLLPFASQSSSQEVADSRH